MGNYAVFIIIQLARALPGVTTLDRAPTHPVDLHRPEQTNLKWTTFFYTDETLVPKTHIGGVQHYKGEFGDGDCAKLARLGATGLQAVNSVREASGWNNKDMASWKCSELRPEVLIPRGSEQKFRMPVRIAISASRLASCPWTTSC